jgi:DNA-binding transcriptional LysR family regulator
VKHQAEIGFIDDEPDSPDVLKLPFAIDEFVLITSPGHPITRASLVGAAELAGLDYVMRNPGAGTRQAVDARFAELGISPRVVLELRTNEAVKQCVMANLGVGIISAWAVRVELEAGRLIAIPTASLGCRRSFHAIVHRSQPATDAQQAFLDLIPIPPQGGPGRLTP